MANENKVSINNTDYELEEVNCWAFDKNIPIIQFGGKAFIGKAIPNQPSIGYEILEFKSASGVIDAIEKKKYCVNVKWWLSDPNWSIHKVRRLSDKVEFCVKDNTDKGVISHFTIAGSEMIASFTMNGGGSSAGGFCNINFLTKVEQPVPLFTKNEVFDKVDIFEGQSYAYTPKETLAWVNVSDGKSTPQPKDSFLYFSTREAAESYVIENKPCLSLKDIYSLDYSNNTPIHTAIINVDKLKQLAQSKIK